MYVNDILLGKYVKLCAVSPEDAQFVIDIRSDAEKTKYLHKISFDYETQRQWILEQNAREADIYMYMEDYSGNKLGLLSIYNYDASDKSAEFGRWISNGNAIQNMESVLLLFDYGFLKMGIKSLHMNTMVDNKKVVKFWKRFGAVKVEENVIEGLLLEHDVVSADEYFGSIRQKNALLIQGFE